MFIVKPDRITIIDSVAGHRSTLAALVAFLVADEASIELEAAGLCHLCPDWPHLRALRFLKTPGKVNVEEVAEGVLQVAGRPDLLAIYAQAFEFETEEHGHHHPEYRDEVMEGMDPASVSIIIEVDDWADDPEGWARENAPDPK